jgi:hypothetical protein
VILVKLVQLDQLVIRVQQVKQDPLVILEQQVILVLQVALDQQVIRVQQVKQDPLVN